MPNTKPIGVAYSDPDLDSATISGAVTAGSVASSGAVSGTTITASTGFVSGTSGVPIAKTSSGNFSSFYGTTSAASGDVRLNYSRLVFTSTGSGETLRAFTQVTGAGAATTGTVNGAHISLSVNGSGTVSGAGNAIRATIGGSSTNPGGTLAAIQLDSDFATGGTWTNTTFLRCTNSGTGVVDSFALIPAPNTGLMFRAKSSASVTHVIKIMADDGTPYYIMVSNAV
jgi:hypothetical protein